MELNINHRHHHHHYSLLLSLSPSPSPSPSTSPELDFPLFFSHLNSLLLLKPSSSSSTTPKTLTPSPSFSSISLSSSSSSKPSSSERSLLSPLDRAAIGALAGAFAGGLTYVALLPLDAVKTRLQTLPSSSASASSAVAAASSILRSHGPLGFYRGLSAVLLGSAASSALYFGTCELAKSLLRTLTLTLTLTPPLNPFFVPPLAGALGNVVSSAVMVPKELLTQRMQAGAGAHRRTLDLALHILRQDGVFGLYAGYAATLLRNLPAGILSYSSFEYLKAFVLRLTKKPHLEPAHSVACGALAGAISASLTTPLDVVKTRLMTQPQGEGSRKVFETMRQIVVEEGWAGLARGIGPRVLHSACFAAIGYCAFETARLAILQWYIQQREKAVVKSAA